ncbi:armadillo-type protein [Geopyxis carbonaria]|nr:armadillo-type protein [Geopyxis carbonaria]
MAPFLQEERQRTVGKKKSLSSLSLASFRSKKNKDTSPNTPVSGSPIRGSFDITDKLRDLVSSNRVIEPPSPQKPSHQKTPSKSRSTIDINLLRRKKPENKENQRPSPPTPRSTRGTGLGLNFNHPDLFGSPGPDLYAPQFSRQNSADSIAILPRDASPSRSPVRMSAESSTRGSEESPRRSQRQKDVDDLVKKYTPTEYTPASQRSFFQQYEPTLAKPADRDSASSKTSKKSRPKSSYVPPSSSFKTGLSIASPRKSYEHSRGPEKSPPEPLRKTKTATNSAQSSIKSNQSAGLDLAGIDSAFEALLITRGVPENMKDKMRGLDVRVKQEFIHKERQMEKTAKEKDSASIKSNSSAPTPGFFARRPRTAHDEPRPKSSKGKPENDTPGSPTKKVRPRSRTFGSSKEKETTPAAPSSPIKKGRADRTIFTPSTTAAIPVTGPPSPTMMPSFTPEEWVKWLKEAAHRRNFGHQMYADVKNEKATLEKDMKDVKIIHLHKLRLVLRNEALRYVETFLKLGGMEGIWAVVERVLGVEWREDHEDQIFHELLLCLKGLCTASLALQKLAEMASTIFPCLLDLLFDEEHKGPAEFNTRGLIINLLYAHLNSSTASQRPLRTRRILGYLSDKKNTNKNKLEFIEVAHINRPYKRWVKEVVDVTKEVFWIFLHGANVIPVPPAISTSLSYSERNFPSERPPQPAAAHVGGVEWEATTYLATHLDLLNGCIACLATREERNELRGDLKNSGWERAMGGALRTCKEKLHSSVHEGLKTWVRAATEDEWYVGDVRFGPRPETRSRPVSPVKRKQDAPPKLELGGNIGVGMVSDGNPQNPQNAPRRSPRLSEAWNY